MKSLKQILTTVLILLFTAGWAQAQDQVAVPLSNPGEPGKLELGVVRGTITVTGYDGEEVIIKYSGAKSDDGDQKVTKDGLKRISNNSVGFEATEDDNVVEIDGVFPMQSISFEISVPRNFSLDLSSVNGGPITVENVNGEMEISNVNGGIMLTNVSGSAVVNTVNGEIKASFNSVAADQPMAFSNLNGNIDVTFPANTKVTTKMKSEWGEVYTDFDMDINRNETGNVNTESRSGSYKISVNNWIYGKINGGGPEYLFKSMRGNIYIRKK